MTSSLYFSISNHPLITVSYDDNGVVIFFIEGNPFPFLLDNENNLIQVNANKNSEVIKVSTIQDIFNHAQK
jgi:hypothetical protein